jgi:hypothetical protein
MKGTSICTPKTSANSDERIKLLISNADALKMTRGKPWKATVTDLVTGIEYPLQGCACSMATCFCDAVVVNKKLLKFIKKLGEAVK